jgi:TetR/AcrR family transcriptional regulator
LEIGYHRLGSCDGRAQRARVWGHMRAKTEIVRQRILAAALETMCDVGYEAASTRLVAERAGLSQSLMRYYFQTKEELWLAMIGEVMTTFSTDLSAGLKELRRRDPASVLRVVIDRIVRLGVRTPGFHRITLMEGTQNSPRLPWLIDEHFRTFYEFVFGLIKEGQALGQVRKLEPARLTYTLAALIGGFFAAAQQLRLLSGKDMFEPEEVDETIGFVSAILFED